MSQTALQPNSTDSTQGTGRWMVVMYNNDFNSVDEVVLILLEATKCTYDEACIETWEAHHYGRAAVHFSTKDECEEVAVTIGSIGVQAEVCKEWDD